MAKRDYDAVAEQIGNLGGITEVPEVEEQLGKLKHKSSYGAKEDLTEEEEKSKAAFLKKRNSLDEQVKVSDDAMMSEGWIMIDRRQMGIRSQFYKEGYEFYIRPATVQAIKNWIGVDEKNAYQLNTVFDEIIKLCVRIKNGEQTVSWSKLNTWDRFWFILKVRELTFAQNKKTITFEDNCPECDEETVFELRADTLHYEFPDQDIVEKHWDAESLEWFIDPAEYGLEGEKPIRLWVPTLAKQQLIIDWAQRQYNRKKKLDETFVSMYLPWLLENPSRDEAMLDRQIQKIEKEYKCWSVELHTLMTDIIRNITINPKETLKQTCMHCGEEVISNVQFPEGVKVLFALETGVQKFGSR
jgi:rRNA maturation protein Nop10